MAKSLGIPDSSLMVYNEPPSRVLDWTKNPANFTEVEINSRLLMALKMTRLAREACKAEMEFRNNNSANDALSTQYDHAISLQLQNQELQQNQQDNDDQDFYYSDYKDDEKYPEDEINTAFRQQQAYMNPSIQVDDNFSHFRADDDKDDIKYDETQSPPFNSMPNATGNRPSDLDQSTTDLIGMEAVVFTENGNDDAEEIALKEEVDSVERSAREEEEEKQIEENIHTSATPQ